MLPLVGGGHTRMQPVFAGDVAEGIAKAVDGDLKSGTIYEFGGPDVHTFKELMEFVLATVERRRLLLPIPFGVMKVQAADPAGFAEAADHARSGRAARHDNVVSDDAKRDGRTLEGLGHHPGIDRGDRADLPVALPQDRPVPGARGLGRLIPESRYDRACKPAAATRRREIGMRAKFQI